MVLFIGRLFVLYMHQISVIVTSYNNGQYIKKALDSIINNTFKDIEIIVVEDCSTDNSKNIINQVIKGNPNVDIKLIENEKNVGAGMSRKIGIEHATGEWISLIDADDWIEPEFFEKLISNVDDSIDIVYGRINYAESEDMIERDFIHYSGEITVSDNMEMMRNFTYYGLHYLNYNLTRRKLYDEIGGYCKARFVEDTPTAVALVCMAKSIKVIPYYGYNYRSVPTSLTHVHNDADRAFCMIYNMIDIVKFLKDKGKDDLSNLLYNNLISDFYKNCSLYRLDADDMEKVNARQWKEIVDFYKIDLERIKKTKEYISNNMSTVRIIKANSK